MPSDEQRAALDALAARVVRLGHSSSLVAVRMADGVENPRWIPATEGQTSMTDEHVLRTVDAGQLELLCETFEQQGESPGRVMPARFQRYVRPEPAPAPRPLVSLFGDDWIVFRRVRPKGTEPWFPSTRAIDFGRALRGALLTHYGPNAPEILSGHAAKDAPSLRPHAAFLPLPFVGSEYADGTILGVALVLPRGASAEERRAVFRALGRWEASARRGDEELPELQLTFGRGGEFRMARVDDVASMSSLRPSTWCGASKTWASATPVALDRNPGDLRSSDPRREAAAYAEAEESVARACEHIGLPRPSRVTVLPAAPLAGAAKARQFPPFTTGKIQRVLVHATLSFADSVAGPVLLGAGRFFGLGLFRPLRGSDA
jgi:CRISPR-associated protein Csb2